MTDTITGGTGYEWVDGYYVPTETTVTITPALILGYESESESGNLLHPILGSEDTSATLRPARRRKGQLSCLFHGASAEVDSKTAEDALRGGVPFVLASDDLAAIGMTFVVTGSLTRTLDPGARKSWTVKFGYQEVSL